MIIVTGAAGFIGANLVQALNQRGQTDILAVDNLTNAAKVKNLADLKIADYMDKHEFYEALSSQHDWTSVRAVLHQGACSDTMATDGAYVLRNNYSYSKALYHFCQRVAAQYIYASSASVYGSGTTFIESPQYETALNAYAYSKLLFDNYVRQQPAAATQVVGLRYFNVYGPREQHKLRMASVAWHFYHQYREHTRLRLFKGRDGYADGEQSRDFISVEDVVAVNMFLLEHADIHGIFNLGTGQCRSFNAVALAIINSCRQLEAKPRLGFNPALASGLIEYIDMPPALHGKYQNYTQANIDKLRAVGYQAPLLDIDQGIARYVQYLCAA